ncbi:MAG: hypothetical protein JWP52_4296 [Rhizobacter sp.]|nr:hypothetical protein [Rhizobacter sp.]
MEKKRRTLGTQNTVAQSSHLQSWIYRFDDVPQFAVAFHTTNEVPKVVIFHTFS